LGSTDQTGMSLDAALQALVDEAVPPDLKRKAAVRQAASADAA
jgi:threonyl-tRNA synthetase